MGTQLDVFRSFYTATLNSNLTIFKSEIVFSESYKNVYACQCQICWDVRPEPKSKDPECRNHESKRKK